MTYWVWTSLPQNPRAPLTADGPSLSDVTGTCQQKDGRWPELTGWLDNGCYNKASIAASPVHALPGSGSQSRGTEW
jgi:hypothetical protein